MSDTQNVTQDSAAILAALADAGVTFGTPKTRSSIGLDVVNTLTTVGMLAIALSKEASDVDVARIAELGKKLNVHVQRDSDKVAASIKSNIERAGERKKMLLGIVPLKSDVSAKTIGYYVQRKPGAPKSV